MIGPLVIVLDASVVAAWYVSQPASQRAREAVPDSNAVYAAPDFVLADVAAALHASGAYGVQEVLGVLERLQADLVLEPISGKMLKAALAWMYHYGLPVRALLPLALAREAGAPLLTCDRLTVERLRDRGASELLKDVVLLA
ncbi:MAG: type II toxin-antitoxin system VapC family toxin [Candidatus Sericytochromatia bacterium]|nr:type II toxin-antitoxin system VapC family toxin [Candidatus Tanganyikabacteria bacterium]